MAQVTSEIGLPFYEVNGEALFGQREGGFHPGRAAADNQRAILNGHVNVMLGFQEGNSGHSHSHEFFGFCGGLLPVIRMDPGTLVTNIGHLKEKWIQPCGPDAILKERPMSQRGTTGYDDSIKRQIPHPFAYKPNSVLRTSVQIVFSVDDARQ